MSQRLVIRLIPVHVLLLCAIAGWSAFSAVLALIQNNPVSLSVAAAAPQQSQDTAPVEPAAAPVGTLSSVFTPEVLHWKDKILAWSAAYGLDPNLVATVMQIESCGAPGVVSSSGAQGLFQVMPFHFTAGEAMQDPDTNAARGLAYLALGLERGGGDAGLALAGYNGGHSQIGKDGSLWPNQTQRYWYWGTGIYDEARNGAAQSGRLQEWLQAGGASLCRTAASQIGLAAQ
jgi:soluble lytic murein transglycosylase-like protein